MMKNSFIKFCFSVMVMTVVSSCNLYNVPDDAMNEVAKADTGQYTAEIIPAMDASAIRTPKGASQLDLEVPLRCQVNWRTQEMVVSVPYNMKSFSLVRNGANDILPRFEVTGLSFDTMPAQRALLKLTKEAGMKLVAKDAPYSSLSAENVRGEFSDVVNMITDASEIFYSYDDKTKTIKLSRKANFTLYVPHSRPIALGLLDVLRGDGVTDVTVDWEDFSITFDADYELKNKIMKLVKYFEESPILIVYDVTVFRIYPHGMNGSKDIVWQDLLNLFVHPTLKTSKSGVIGRVLTTSDELTVDRLQAFLQQQAVVRKVASGKFVVPNLWLSRFDIGKCGSRDDIESGLSIMAKASFEQTNKIFSHITLEGADGEITQFNIRSKLGENYLIIGLPNEVFGEKAPKSETVVFMMPRIVRTAKTSKHFINKI